jgi:hypothetical protein
MQLLCITNTMQMHPVQEWLNSKEKNFIVGAKLYEQYAKNQNLKALFSKTKRPDMHAKKLQYEMQKLWDKDLVFQAKTIEAKQMLKQVGKQVNTEKQKWAKAIVDETIKTAEIMFAALKQPQPISEKEQKEFESVWDIPWQDLPEPIKDLINRRKDTKRQADFYSNANLEQYQPKERSEHAEKVLQWDAEIKEMDAQLEQWRTNRILPTENSGKVDIDPNDKVKLINERNNCRSSISKYKGQKGKEHLLQKYLERKEVIDILLGDAV